jgi:glycosyltransferase involved in cell wall biosynthesis
MIHNRDSKTAVIFNDYFSTLGGGERSAIDTGRALRSLGYRIVLASTLDENLNLKLLLEQFGVFDDSGWDFKFFLNHQVLSKWVANQDIEVFINHSFGSFMENPFVNNLTPNRSALYFVMYPHHNSPTCINKLSSYNYICCNSYFTLEYLKRNWNDTLNAKVVYPPISEFHLLQPDVQFNEKKRSILLIGRFNVHEHNKNQLEAIKAFIKLKQDKILDKEWELTVIGRVNCTTENQAYLKSCQKLAEGFQILIKTDVSITEIAIAYREATYLWQFTGYGNDFGVNPYQCEHLGLVAIDCYKYGVIPVVFHRGGMVHIINHGIDGYCFGSYAELADIYNESYSENFQKFRFETVKNRTVEFSFNSFTEQLNKLITS